MTKEEFVDWKNSKVTQEVMDEVRRNLVEYKEQFENGRAMGTASDGFYYGQYVGRIQAYKDLLGIEYED